MIAVSEPPDTAVVKRRVGRPRRLTLDTVLEVACELGLDRIEMGALAQRLNTGVGTLYSYVRNRDHLLQLVAERLAGRSRIEDTGQDWRDLLRQHAAMVAAVFADRPQLLGDLLAGGGGVQGHDYAVDFIAMLVDRGFERSVATALYIEASQIVLGAAVCARRRHVSVEQGHPDIDAPSIPPIVGDHRPTLERLIRDVDAGNAGTDLDPPPMCETPQP